MWRPSTKHYQFSVGIILSLSTILQKVPFKDTSIVQQAGLVYHIAIEAPDIRNTRKMSMVSLSDVKQHNLTALSRKESCLTYAKNRDPWRAWSLKVHTADHCSLPISKWVGQTNPYRWFAYHVKTSFPRCNEDDIQMISPPSSNVNSTESEKHSRLFQTVHVAVFCFGNNIFSLCMNKRTYLHGNAALAAMHKALPAVTVGFWAHWCSQSPKFSQHDAM